MSEDIPWSKGDPEKLFSKRLMLDEGAFGTVWKGNLKYGNQAEVAIKLMPWAEEVLDELRSEVNFLKNFDSPFVIHYYGTFWNRRSDEIWIVMELAELGSLEGIMIFCEYSFSESQLAALFARSLLGIDYVHSKGLIHQDIKAKNILLTLNGQVKLADFGVASTVTNVNKNKGTVSGSPHWMAPEILTGSEITQKCDIWSLGITLLELTEGAPPFADIPPMNVISVIPERAAPTFENPGRWSKSVRAFLSRMCDKDPEKRRTAQRLMKHPFVKEEVSLALSGEHSLLRDLAESCVEGVHEARVMLDGGGSEKTGSVIEEYDYDYDTESSSDDGEVVINNSPRKYRPVKKPSKGQSSFDSLHFDESKLEVDSVKKKSRKKGRRTRMTRVNADGTKSVFSKHQSAKISLMKNRKKLELNLDDVRKTKTGANKKKAEDLLQKIMNLTNRKQL